MQFDRRAFIGVSLGALSVTTIAGCLGGVAETNAVDIEDDGFDPQNIRVATPEDGPPTVTFTNRSDEEHQVANASNNWDFESEVIGPNQMIHAEFPGDGVYDAVCPIHGDADDLDGTEFKVRIAIGDETEIDDTL